MLLPCDKTENWIYLPEQLPAYLFLIYCVVPNYIILLYQITLTRARIILAGMPRHHHMCVFCRKTFQKGEKFFEHLRTHTLEKPYYCRICMKSIKCRDNLKSHARIHTGERPFTCNLCFKTFRTSSHLSTHSRSHTDIKPYLCTVCGHRFRTISILREHSSVHTGEKPNECVMCGKCFRTRSNLIYHTSVHTHEKPHDCDVCDKSFRTLRHLKSHARTHIKKAILRFPTNQEIVYCDVQQFSGDCPKDASIPILNDMLPAATTRVKKEPKEEADFVPELKTDNSNFNYGCCFCSHLFFDVESLELHCRMDHAIGSAVGGYVWLVLVNTIPVKYAGRN